MLGAWFYQVLVSTKLRLLLSPSDMLGACFYQVLVSIVIALLQCSEYFLSSIGKYQAPSVVIA